MLIGELAAKTGLSRDTIRFYEKHGLIRLQSKARRANNYKEYPREVISTVASIKSLKQWGFTLHEIKEAIDLWTNDSFDCEIERPKVLKKISRIEAQIQQLTEIRNTLLLVAASCPVHCEVVNALKGS